MPESKFESHIHNEFAMYQKNGIKNRGGCHENQSYESA